MLGKGLILVVEDAPALQATISRYLTDLRFQVVMVNDGPAALGAIRTQMPTAICVDTVLPRGSGYEVCEAIRRTPGLGNIPILVMSESFLPEDRAHAEEAGASAFLPKPFTRDQFTRQIRGLLDKQPLSMRTLRKIH